MGDGDTLEAQAREIIDAWSRQRPMDDTLAGLLATWARRLVAEGRAGALKEAEANIAERRRDESVLRGIIAALVNDPVREEAILDEAFALAAEGEPGAQDRAGEGEK